MKKMVLFCLCLSIMLTAHAVMTAENWYDMVKLHGLIWANAYYKTADADDERDGKTSDTDLNRMQFAADVRVHPQASGYIRYRWDNAEVVFT